MKLKIALSALLLAAVYAKPVPEIPDYEVDPDCEEADFQEVEPEPLIIAKPAFDDNQIIKKFVDYEEEEEPSEECEDQPLTDAPATTTEPTQPPIVENPDDSCDEEYESYQESEPNTLPPPLELPSDNFDLDCVGQSCGDSLDLSADLVIQPAQAMNGGLSIGSDMGGDMDMGNPDGMGGHGGTGPFSEDEALGCGGVGCNGGEGSMGHEGMDGGVGLDYYELHEDKNVLDLQPDPTMMPYNGMESEEEEPDYGQDCEEVEAEGSEMPVEEAESLFELKYMKAGALGDEILSADDAEQVEECEE